LNVHPDFAQVAIWQDGLVRQAGQIAMTAEALKIFADSLAPTDVVARRSRRCCGQLDFHAQELRLIDQELARVALGGQDTKRLMTIPGVDVTVAMSITAAVGDFQRFSSPNKLVSYLGLNPRSTPASPPPRAGARARAGR
jgi:transposase